MSAAPARLKALAEMKPRPYLSAAQIADIVFGVTLDRFYHMTKKLRARGFPTPVPGCGYDPLAITAWQDIELLGSFGRPAPRAPINVDDIAALDLAALERQAMERV